MADTTTRNSYVFSLREVDKTKLEVVGGKGAHLGELSRMEGIHVPDGFCLSTEAFKRIIRETPPLTGLLHQLSLLKAEDSARIGALSGAIRRHIEAAAIPQDIAVGVSRFLSLFGEKAAYAVRSSATAEDLPSVSFAGQQDTYLNITGKEAILKHISKCWASLFTERAISYRIQNGFDHRNVSLAVVVQQMVFPQAAGILFTADPVTSNRKVLSIDAGFGLGEALVGALVNTDVYKVRAGRILDKKIRTKKRALYARKEGGTEEQEIEPGRQQEQVLTDEQILQLERLGRKIEAHFGYPQDVEWCLADNGFYIVQSRPITTLYPIPEAADQENHIYISVGHQQMMTDAMKPLGISLWQLTAGRPMHQAGGRLFVDVAKELASPASRETVVTMLGKSDPLLRDALQTIINRDDLIQPLPDNAQEGPVGNKQNPFDRFGTLQEYDPQIVSQLVQRSQTATEEVKQAIQTKSGTELFQFIREDILELKKSMSDPQAFGAIITAMNASSWINEKMNEWLGEKGVADTLSQSVPHNITSEMGLALLDVADVIRPYPEIIRYLQQANNDNFLHDLDRFEGGKETREAIRAFLDKYGMRCAGEIDITRPRWSEKPGMLIPIILSNIKNVAPGASQRKLEQGRTEALKKREELLDRLKRLPDGQQKAEETSRMIDLVRNFIGYREYPKYSMISRYFVYKEALLKEAEGLAQAGLIQEKEDVYYLSFDEFQKAVRTRSLDQELIRCRKEAYRSYQKLTPPRVMTSDGEIITGAYKRDDLPARAIAGLAVSSGVAEGRARVILNMENADLEEGDILVTAFTDPSWTPLFVSIKGLVTEVGGLMTHGAVIAREYGLPAVVGAEHATRLIKDGQRIRVHGTEGYVELL